jgi:hypothetical protein
MGERVVGMRNGRGRGIGKNRDWEGEAERDG